MKNRIVTCPYCLQRAVLCPANFVHRDSPSAVGKHLYVCSNWPRCDSYVSVRESDLSPMGTLANKKLRQRRIQAHKALERYRKATGMSKQEVYLWLRAKMGLDSLDGHIAKFDEEQCQEVIQLCDNARRQYQRKVGRTP